MKFAVVGWNFRTTPIEIREKLSLSPVQKAELTQKFFQALDLQELVMLSTCNRLEVYAVAPQPPEALEYVRQYWSQHLNLPQLSEMAYSAFDLEAVRHLFRVVSSLDSMIIGEPQILGQVKEAYQQALEIQSVGAFFKALFPKSFGAAKRVRTETQIANFAVSISFAAVELAKRIFGELSNQTVMIIGAGEMAELAARHFLKNGVSKLLVTNRTFANAVKLAEETQGSAVPFEQLGEYLEDADIVIGSTGAHHYVVTQEMVKHSLRRRKDRPMFFIDIAVPRDMDPAINNLSDVYYYDVDDLQNVVDDNRRERERQAQQAEHILNEEVEKVYYWFKSLSALPTLKALRQSFHEIGQAELTKTLKRLPELGPGQRALIERMVQDLINKLLHAPSSNLKKLTQQESTNLYLEALAEVFELSPVLLSIEESPIQAAGSPVLSSASR